MKKINLIAFALLLGAVACKKNNITAVAEQTIEVSIDPNTSYEYALDKGTNVEITAKAAHATVSGISTAASGSKTFIYLPDSNYTGSDNVTLVVSPGNGRECKGNKAACQKQEGGCSGSGSEGVKTTYRFKFTVGNTVQN